MVGREPDQHMIFLTFPTPLNCEAYHNCRTLHSLSRCVSLYSEWVIKTRFTQVQFITGGVVICSLRKYVRTPTYTVELYVLLPL